MKVLRGRCRRVALPLVRPIRTAKTLLTSRDVLFVELEAQLADGAVARGYAEGVAFETDWYLPETLGQDEAILPALIDALAGRELADPREADALLRAVPGGEGLPMARAAVEPAVWDLFAQEAGLPLAEYLRRQGESGAGAGSWGGAGDGELATADGLSAGQAGTGADGLAAGRGGAGDGELAASWAAPGGVVIPLGSEAETLEAVAHAAAAGYARVKLKISEPGHLFVLRAIRRDHPELQVIADANGAFSERDFVRIRDEVDSVGLACIEEPVAREPGESTAAFYARLEAIQMRMSTPICLDESWTGPADLELALRHTLLQCYAVKMAKLGGIGPTLDFLDLAAERGIAVWMGGMFDSGISKAAHAALSLHPAIAFAGDISDTSRYFAQDPCEPAFALEGGRLPLLRPGLGWAVRSELFAS